VPDERARCIHVPLRFAGRYLDSFEQSTPAHRAGIQAVERLIDGSIDSLTLIGPYGAGKSHLAAIAANELAERRRLEGLATRAELDAHMASGKPLEPPTVGPSTWRPHEYAITTWLRRIDELADIPQWCAQWLPFARTIVELKAEMNSRRVDIAAHLHDVRYHPGLVVIDDLGAENPSAWTAEQLYALVSARYDGCLPTLVTSNLPAARLAEVGYGSVVSRLAERGVILEMTSSDRRIRMAESVA
jgi:DNA replication protein DnaC